MNRLSFWPIAWTWVVFVAVVFTLDVLAGLVLPNWYVMQKFWKEILPDYTFISWGAHLMWLIESFMAGLGAAVVYVPIHNFFASRKGAETAPKMKPATEQHSAFTSTRSVRGEPCEAPGQCRRRSLILCLGRQSMNMTSTGFKGRDRILKLIKQSEARIDHLRSDRAVQLGTPFRKARKTLEAPILRKQSTPLLLAAARRDMREAGRISVGYITGKVYIPGREMDQLVHIRLASAEIEVLLDKSLDEARLGPRRSDGNRLYR